MQLVQQVGEEKSPRLLCLVGRERGAAQRAILRMRECICWIQSSVWSQVVSRLELDRVLPVYIGGVIVPASAGRPMIIDQLDSLQMNSEACAVPLVLVRRFVEEHPAWMVVARIE